jgi:hypothetical protein
LHDGAVQNSEFPEILSGKIRNSAPAIPPSPSTPPQAMKLGRSGIPEGACWTLTNFKKIKKNIATRAKNVNNDF